MPRRLKRPTADHAMRAADMRRHPRVWIEVGTYNSRQSAESTAGHIRRGEHLRHYGPPGAFETRTAPTEHGHTLYARYIGDPA
jgi:hypothetical protein